MNKERQKLRVAPIGIRYVSYILDLIVLGCITTIILAAFQISPVLFLGSFLYFQGTETLNLLPSRDVMFTLISFIFLATGYFFLEPYMNTSVGKFLTGQRIVILKRSSSSSRHKYFMGALIRAIIKAFPPANFIDCLFIFKYKRFNQRYTDAHNGFVVIKKEQTPLKEYQFIFTMMDYLFISAIIYYLPLVTMTVRSYFFSASSLGTEGSVSPNTYILVEDAFNRILTNNLSLNTEFILGGIVLLSLSVLIIFSSSFIEGAIFSVILKNQPSSMFYGVLPHFFFETGGYVAGIAAGLIISVMIIDWSDAYVKGKKIFEASEIFTNAKCFLIFIIISVILIFVGAMIEAAMFR